MSAVERDRARTADEFLDGALGEMADLLIAFEDATNPEGGAIDTADNRRNGFHAYTYAISAIRAAQSELLALRGELTREIMGAQS